MGETKNTLAILLAYAAVAGNAAVYFADARPTGIAVSTWAAMLYELDADASKAGIIRRISCSTASRDTKERKKVIRHGGGEYYKYLVR